MARLVVLSFQDNTDAEHFIGEVLSGAEFAEATLKDQCEVLGLYPQPTLFCDPTDGHRGKKTRSGWTQGKKYGWWVCAVCKKPSTMWGKNIGAIVSHARNMLPDLLAQEETTSPTPQQ